MKINFTIDWPAVGIVCLYLWLIGASAAFLWELEEIRGLRHETVCHVDRPGLHCYTFPLKRGEIKYHRPTAPGSKSKAKKSPLI